MSELHIGQAMQQFLQKSRLKNGLLSYEIKDVWLQLMGKTIAKYTDKIEIIQNTLFIHTSVGPLKQELLYQKEIIIQRVNEALKENVISKVVIK